MYHSINFSISGPAGGETQTYNTWDSWRLIPYPRPSIAMPKVRTKYLEIPGMHGQLDISEILTGKPLYENRSGSWEFYISRRPFSNGIAHDWRTTWRKVAEAIHGKTGTVWLEDDPYYAFSGRFALSEKFDAQKDYSKITIEYTVSPWPVERYPKVGEDGWKWDPFDFYRDQIDPSTTPPTLVEKEYL